jgi:uncharacterized protein (TIGR02600 family)
MIPPKPFPCGRQKGVALIIVLSILVLLTAVVVAFLNESSSNLVVSKGYSEATRAKLLADSVVNLVEGQIHAAAAGVDGGGNPMAWASQPGLVRTYDTTGQPVAAYKLYSSDTMKVAGAFNPTAASTLSEEIPSNWNQKPSDFVDLNSPVLIPDSYGTISTADGSSTNYIARFPIIDGNGLRPLSSPTGGSLLQYDTHTTGTADIEGFSVQQPATYDSTKPFAPGNNPVPMPVRWIYVLQNGELHARDTNGKVANASGTNPIIGRVAFWTDDDTCKLNINTASEGTFWDRPWVKTTTELNFGNFYPAQNEFQMYPGHPAKTCLSTVFGANWLWPVDPLITTNNYSKLLPYYDLTPRVTEGDINGSAGATQTIPTATGIPYDSDRLYASVDELMFKPMTSGTTRPTRNGDSDKTFAAITPQFLETTRFFLTASNRAPEVTLWNTPRITLWPIQSDTKFRTAKDQLIAFCSTIPSNSQNFYFLQRYSATKLTTGQDTGLSCESATTDAQIPRNLVLYQYLKQLLSNNVPGLGGEPGGKLSDKYGDNATTQIAVEMLDQMRSGVNTTVSNNSDSTACYSYTQPQGTSGGGQVVPLQIKDPKNGVTGRGFGRFNTIVSAAVDFFRCDATGTSNTNITGTTTNIGACLILQPFNPTPGFPSWSPNMRVEVLGLDSFGIVGKGDVSASGSANWQGLGFPSDAINVADSISQWVEGTSSTEYNGLITMFFQPPSSQPPASGANATPKSFAQGSGDQTYPFFGAGASGTGTTIHLSGTTAVSGSSNPPSALFGFSGGTITINIYSNPQPPAVAQKLQTLSMKFPPSPASLSPFSPLPWLPLPTYDTKSSGNYTAPADILKYRLSGTNGDGQYSSLNPLERIGTGLIDPDDVVRGMIVDCKGTSKGDYRAISALNIVPAGFFTTHPFYSYPNGPSTASAIDPAPANWKFNWKFAHDLHTGNLGAWGMIGWYDFSGLSASLAGCHVDKLQSTTCSLNDSTTYQGRKQGYPGPLVANVNPSGTDVTIPQYFRDIPPAIPIVPVNSGTQAAAAVLSNGYPGDWDTGYGYLEDGAYVNKPDEGNANQINIYNTVNTTDYFDRGHFQTDCGACYSPNRQISSAVAFGSLPTGIDPTGVTIKPWQTLLFCSNPPAGLMHPGFGTGSTSAGGYPAPPYTKVPDHYLLDLFTMPIVEPYAISEPLSSQGKVNMNYQIAPFTYIRRDTGVRAVLKSTWMAAIPTNAASPALGLTTYKEQGAIYATQIRYAINPDETTGTLKAFEDRFNSGDIFRSASEICGLPLVPKQIAGSPVAYPPVSVPTTPTYTNMKNWWDNFQLTGDNVRESPYGDLYARLTTKSNTFTIHVRVQTLKKRVGTDQGTFIDPTDTATGAKDIVTGEYRGSFQVERYVDPNDSTLPDYASQVTAGGLTDNPINKFYKFRTLSAKEF